jgi:hypothetical protein
MLPIFDWSDWKPLDDSKKIGAPATSGLYRVRDSKSKRILYIGETGSKQGLRGRLSQLRTCFRDEIPYADPHTAAPALWAYLSDGGGPLEASFMAIESDRQTRRALEALAISLIRKEYGESPLVSFGRMPDGWMKSTGNNSRLVSTGKRMKGFRDSSAVRIPSAPSVFRDDDDCISSNWCGLAWSTWSAELPNKPLVGLYRIRSESSPGLLYIGEGKVIDRLSAHRSKARIPNHPQSSYFTGEVLMSWTSIPQLMTVQRHEIENDLIASYFVEIGISPPAQFIG